MQADQLALNAHAAVMPVAVAVLPEMLVEDAISKMSTAQASCVIVTHHQRPIGIFTERDLARAIATAQPIANQPISTVMTHPPKTVQVADVYEASALYRQMQQHCVRHLPVVDKSGQLVGLITYDSLLTAITSLKEPQQVKSVPPLNHSREALESQVVSRTAELRQAENRWRMLLENVQLVVVGLDTHGKVTYANPFFLTLTGYTADEMKDADWFRCFIPPSEHPEVKDYFQHLHIQPEIPLQYQNAILTKSGEERIIVWNNTVLRDQNDCMIGTMSIGEDITERFAIDQIKGEFVAMVSHELRTPLTAIHGGVKLLSQGIVPSDSQQGKDLLRIVAKSSERLSRLVDDILELERLESGEHPLHKQWFNTRSLTRQVFESLQVIANQAEVYIEICDPGIQLLGDHDRLSLVLTNLIDNAIKFSPLRSTVRLTVEEQENFSIDSVTQDTDTSSNSHVLFTVRDQGEGISPEKCDKIFERFVQVTQTGNSDKGGTGLGLTICRNIVEQHGGKIWLESTLGKGSCFFFTIPNNRIRSL